MTVRANMILFHEPDILEFVADGKTLRTVKTPNAKGAFDRISEMPSEARLFTINRLYEAATADDNEFIQRLEEVDPL